MKRNEEDRGEIFQTRFDVAVVGAGLVGFSAARALALQGRKTILIGPGGDLIWEVSRALENSASSVDPAWRRWLGLSAGPPEAVACFDAARREVAAAAEILALAPWCRVLLYAAPVAVEAADGKILRVLVATKSGIRKLEAARWIDATEEGVLARLGNPERPGRQAAVRFRSIVVQAREAGQMDAAARKLESRFPGMECLRSAREGERRLRWPSGSGAWHREAEEVIRFLRAGDVPGGFVVSQCAACDFPVYAPDENAGGGDHPFGNLETGSPALRGEAVMTPGDRFALGERCARAVLGRGSSFWTAASTLMKIPLQMRSREVVVAGTGTAGAVAAIAAGRAGAKTLAFDFCALPGGVGTTGGICGYFHGAPGGLQSELDARVQEMTPLFTGSPSAPGRWHHDAKALVILRMMEEAGVEFLGNAILAGVERGEDGAVRSVRILAEGRAIAVSASGFVDGTGDGDLCALAGAGFTAGREGDGRCLAYSQPALALSFSSGAPVLRHFNFDAGWVDPTDPEDLTRARLEGLAQYAACDWRDGSILSLAPLIGIRQSRHIRTDVTVSMSDLLTRARFEDAIGRVETIADTHAVDFEFEDDQMAFYYWTCRGFRHRLTSELPYRMLLPRGLKNVWIACRAAGVEGNAAYGLRMQREMQRLGEAAGIAAALAARSSGDSRAVAFPTLVQALKKSGALPHSAALPEVPGDDVLLEGLDRGEPTVGFWHLANRWNRVREEVRRRLEDREKRVSFYAAAICAMAKDPAGEDRLVAALETRESGPSPEEFRVPGAHGQVIDIPFWLQAVVLLRRIGTPACLGGLQRLAGEPGAVFNVLTIQALTAERLIRRLGAGPRLAAIVDDLSRARPAGEFLSPSRSLWRSLRGEPQIPLSNDRGIDTRQHCLWQLDLVLKRCRALLEAPSREERSEGVAGRTNDGH